MLRTLQKIQNANPNEAERYLNAIVKRYSVLYPDWDLTMVSLQKSDDKNEQIDRIISFIESLRPTADDPEQAIAKV